MNPDQKTTSALERFTERIEKKIDGANEKGEKQVARVHEKIDGVVNTLSGLRTDFESERMQSKLKFESADRAIEEGKSERRSLWKILGIGATGGGGLTALFNYWTKGGGA